MTILKHSAGFFQFTSLAAPRIQIIHLIERRAGIRAVPAREF